jgi:hypothetical protein
MLFPNQLDPALLITLIGHLALQFVAPGIDIDIARELAARLLARYDARTEEELTLAADIISLRIRMLHIMGKAADPELPLKTVLQIHSSGISLSREAHKTQRILDRLRRDRLKAETALQDDAFPEEMPFATPATERPAGQPATQALATQPVATAPATPPIAASQLTTQPATAQPPVPPTPMSQQTARPAPAEPQPAAAAPQQAAAGQAPTQPPIHDIQKWMLTQRIMDAGKRSQAAHAVAQDAAAATA